MLKRGMKNRDIQFYFNRPDRPVNSGRITGIKNGTYGREVKPATNSALDSFLAAYNDSAAKSSAKSDPNARVRSEAERRFVVLNGKFRLRDGETVDQEGKSDFPWPKFSPIIRTIAGMANRGGGYIFFGIDNVSHEAIGLTDRTFDETDISKMVHKLKTHLMPTPDVVKCIIPVGGKLIGVLYVEENRFPPVVVCRDGDQLNEGDILYRYSGETARIRYGDLANLLQKRDRRSQARLARLATQISEIGSENALVLNASEKPEAANGPPILIDESLLKKIKFIREGHFSEIEGNPTLRIIGDVQAVSESNPSFFKVMDRAIAGNDVLEKFLRQEDVTAPLEYVNLSALSQRQWLPLFFFAKQDPGGVEKAIKSLQATKPQYKASKTAALERLGRNKSAFSPATGRAKPILDRILAGEEMDASKVDDLSATVRAIQALPDKFLVRPSDYLLLLDLLKLADSNSGHMSLIFRAAARLDELAFSNA
jgi:hypothetical protein